jgi:hypothetical protein
VALRKALANVLQLQVGSSYLVWYSLVGPYIPVLITGIIPEVTRSTSVWAVIKKQEQIPGGYQGQFLKNQRTSSDIYIYIYITMVFKI